MCPTHFCRPVRACGPSAIAICTTLFLRVSTSIFLVVPLSFCVCLHIAVISCAVKSSWPNLFLTFYNTYTSYCLVKVLILASCGRVVAVVAISRGPGGVPLSFLETGASPYHHLYCQLHPTCATPGARVCGLGAFTCSSSSSLLLAFKTIQRSGLEFGAAYENLQRGSEKQGATSTKTDLAACSEFYVELRYFVPSLLAIAQRVRPRGALRVDHSGNTDMLDIGRCIHHRGWIPVSGQFGPRVHPYLSGEPISTFEKSQESDSILARGERERRVNKVNQHHIRSPNEERIVWFKTVATVTHLKGDALTYPS